jgi:thioredoxin 1
MTSLTDQSFQETTKIGNWVVQFWAAWCGPCVDTEHLQELEATQDIQVGRVNIEENSILAQKYSIIAVPTYVFLKDGKLHRQLNCIQSVESLSEAAR